jgi:hypothetical protein
MQVRFDVTTLCEGPALSVFARFGAVDTEGHLILVGCRN